MARRLRKSRVLRPEERAALRAIERCRTAVLGGHLDVCTECGYEQPSYNSCRNRHCPKCQAFAQARWIDKRVERAPAVHYFHVVFTLPAELRAVARRSREAVFDPLFASASQTLLELGHIPTPRRSSASPWCSTPGRATCASIPMCTPSSPAAASSEDGSRWSAREAHFLFPVRSWARSFAARCSPL